MADGPFPDRELTYDERREVLEAVNGKVKDLKCEACGSNNFSINTSLASPLLLYPSPSGIEVNLQQSHPCALVHCVVCGNTKLFSLGILGIDPDKWRRG